MAFYSIMRQSTDCADGKRSTWHSQSFTRAKRKVLGEVGSELEVFHCLRYAVAQILERGTTK